MVDESQAKLDFEVALTDDVYRQSWNYSWRLCGNREQAEDLFQDALAHAFLAFIRRKPHSSFRGWLLSIVRTQYLISLRIQKTKVQSVLLAPNENPYVQPATQDVGLEDLPPWLVGALNQISIQQREALELHYLHGLKVEEVGNVLRISKGSVKVRLHRGRLALKKMLSKSKHAGNLSGGLSDE